MKLTKKISLQYNSAMFTAKLVVVVVIDKPLPQLHLIDGHLLVVRFDNFCDCRFVFVDQ